MGISARIPTGADTAGFIPELWAQLLIDAAQKSLVCWDACDKSWQTGKGKGDTVNIGLTNHVAATVVAVGSEGSSLDIATGTKKQLVMDQWYEAVIPVDTMTLYQSQIDWPTQCRKEAEYALRLVIDSSVAALFSSLNLSAGVKGSNGEAVSDDLLIEVSELLNEADVPLDNDRFLIIDPSAASDMMKYDKFTAMQYIGVGAVENGQIAKNHPIYGCSVRITNNLASAGTGNCAAMMHRKAIASALQINLPYEDRNSPRKHQIFFCHEALWGVLEVRDTFGVCFYTRHA